MIGDELNGFQIALRVAFVITLMATTGYGAALLSRRLGALLPRRPRVVTMTRHRDLMRRTELTRRR